MGKTRLAQHAARLANQTLALRFINGVYFVPLAGVNSPSHLAGAIATVLEASPAGRRDPLTALLDYLRNKELLLVLDNFEHLLEGVDQIAQILAHCPDVKILVTSREFLNLSTEHRFVNIRGNIAMNIGDYPRSRALFSEVAAIFADIGYLQGKALALSNLGTTYARLEDYTNAEPLYTEARATAVATGDINLVVVTTSNLGSVATGLGDFALAEAHYQESLALAREIGLQRWIAANLNGLSKTYLTMGRSAAAEQAAQEALAVAAAIDVEPDALGSLSFLAQIWASRGAVEAALRVLLFIEQHPKSMERDRRYNRELLAELQVELPPRVVSAAAQWSRGRTLEDMLAWLEAEAGLSVQPSAA
jgi:tetratricopeptide (TPR) repeat protein